MGVRRRSGAILALGLALAQLGCAAAGSGARSGAAPPAAETTPAGPLATLAGADWVLTAWSHDEPAPAEPRVTLRVGGEGLTGRAACNTYFAAVAPGGAPGAIVVGPIGTTRMACPAPVMAVERRYLELLARVRRFERDADRLTLRYEGEGGDGAMLFRR